MDTYIVRIYHQENVKTCGFAGVVEAVGIEGRMAFKSLDELAGILDLRVKRSKRKVEKRALKRLPLKLPMTVSGVDIDGRRFRENTTTVDLSTAGVNFRMARQVPMGADLALVITPGVSALKLKARVVRCAESGEMMSIGTVFG